MTGSRLLAAACRAVSALAIAAPLALVFGWSLWTLAARPALPGEAEVLFEASRIRAGLALYVDPAAGAYDYGPLPARYLVTYPPIWSWVLSHVPNGTAATVFARLASTAAWLAALGIPALRARPGCRGHALAAAGFYAGTFNLALFADSGRPDSVAVLLASAALARAVRGGRVDGLSGALFALAAWTKPTVFGLAAGALLAGLGSPRRALPGFAGAAAVSAAVVAVLEAIAGHAWFTHLIRSNLQPIALRVWLDAMSHDALFFAGPAAYALALGLSRRRSPDVTPGVTVALAALLGALAWTLFARAKVGSSTNYWMESSVGVVTLCALVPPPAAAARPALAALGLAQALWVGVASVQSAAYRTAADLRIADLIARARPLCGASPGDFVMSDDPAAELLADGRVYTTGYQMTFLALDGRYPTGPWIADLDRPEVTCFVEHTRIMRAVPALARALDARFTPVASTDDWTVLRASPASRAPTSCAGRPPPADNPGAPPGP